MAITRTKRSQPGGRSLYTRHQSRIEDASGPAKSPLSRLPLMHILRSIAFGLIFKSPRISRYGTRCLEKLANNRQGIWHPENNPVVRGVLRRVLYDHFCAGTKPSEVKSTVAKVKQMGYSGIILNPSREIMLDEKNEAHASFTLNDDGTSKQIEGWRDLYLETLSMVGPGDYVGLKYTGAGSAVTEALRHGRGPPPGFINAVDALCNQAAAQGSLLWVDAEQQALQPAINQWTLDLMRRHNTKGTALVSNTYQAYLKSCPADLDQHLRIAQREGWKLGVKLVRGAYITSDVRQRIHDTKQATDNCYDTIAAGLITRSLPAFRTDRSAPCVDVFLAGHNASSIAKATELYRDAVLSGKRTSQVRWGQLQGMADEVSCNLLQQADAAEKLSQAHVSPPVFKCLQWGTVGECLQFLVRRAVENSGAAERMAESSRDMWGELLRRVNLRVR